MLRATAVAGAAAASAYRWQTGDAVARFAIDFYRLPPRDAIFDERDDDFFFKADIIEVLATDLVDSFYYDQVCPIAMCVMLDF